jgi:hypothetical protein
MGTVRELRYSVYVVLLDEYVGTLPRMRLRNPKRHPSKPCVYLRLTLYLWVVDSTFAEPHQNISGDCINSAFA